MKRRKAKREKSIAVHQRTLQMAGTHPALLTFLFGFLKGAVTAFQENQLQTRLPVFPVLFRFSHVQMQSQSQGQELFCGLITHKNKNQKKLKKKTHRWLSGSLKAIASTFPTELLPFIFITLHFLFPRFPDNGADKRTIYNSFLTAGHYLITSSGSYIVCWRLFKVLGARRRNGETYIPGWAVARTCFRSLAPKGHLSEPLMLKPLWERWR